jgi:hypothetical protein
MTNESLNQQPTNEAAKPVVQEGDEVELKTIISQHLESAMFDQSHHPEPLLDDLRPYLRTPAAKEGGEDLHRKISQRLMDYQNASYTLGQMVLKENKTATEVAQMMKCQEDMVRLFNSFVDFWPFATQQNTGDEPVGDKTDV